uniref:Uncharacterized protein n=1 Tax=Oryza meridionalis TaxID=40149 RepID=A0A0E0F5J4_9ORYZ
MLSSQQASYGEEDDGHDEEVLIPGLPARFTPPDRDRWTAWRLPRRDQLVAGGDNDKNECVYTLYVETGWIWMAGTDAAIGVELAAVDSIAVGDLERWGGLMGAGHD